MKKDDLRDRITLLIFSKPLNALVPTLMIWMRLDF